jgi:hypothetical protein
VALDLVADIKQTDTEATPWPCTCSSASTKHLWQPTQTSVHLCPTSNICVAAGGYQEVHTGDVRRCHQVLLRANTALYLLITSRTIRWSAFRRAIKGDKAVRNAVTHQHDKTREAASAMHILLKEPKQHRRCCQSYPQLHSRPRRNICECEHIHRLLSAAAPLIIYKWATTPAARPCCMRYHSSWPHQDVLRKKLQQAGHF